TAPPRRAAASSPCIGPWRPPTARRTKGATCCCERSVPAGGAPHRAGRGAARAELPAVPSAGPQLRRPRAGGRAAARARAGARPPRGAARGVLVRLPVTGPGPVLAGRRLVALHPAVRPRVPGDHLHLRPVACGAVLARGAGARAGAIGAALGGVPHRLDRSGVDRRPPGRHPVSMAWPWDLARGRTRARAVG